MAFFGAGVPGGGGYHPEPLHIGRRGGAVHLLEPHPGSFVFVQDQEQVDKLIAARKKLSHVRQVIYIDPTGMGSYGDDPWLISFRDLLEMGRKLDQDRPELFSGGTAAGKPEETALMIQTSGTTGLPKLAMLSHRNLTAIGESWIKAVSIKPGENWISMSPPAWIVDQMWGLGVALLGGMTMNFPETPETVMEDFRDIGPSRIITASRFWEELASRIRVRMSDAGWVKRRLFREAERIGRAVLARQIRKEPISPLLKSLHHLAALIDLSTPPRPDRLCTLPERLHGRPSHQPRCDQFLPGDRSQPEAVLWPDRSWRESFRSNRMMR